MTLDTLIMIKYPISIFNIQILLLIILTDSTDILLVWNNLTCLLCINISKEVVVICIIEVDN